MEDQDLKRLKNLLAQGRAIVKFTKLDGTVREMDCTLNENYIPKESNETKRVKAKNDEVLAVYDVVKAGWRSFRLDSIISFR